ncbi:aldehyde dehydrogenase [Prauserella marina]|uniref:Aldehyde dehydrogenase (NAD+) n=1 Tax=Prauserella marina TaxID=530584 RepID=A0A222VPH5_9PSEU|nr:aldehyde dehydrogenase family protein [Prauserella marina]ASR35825.1 aldehyde dehydrogenase [Prauserella marina]PWV84264.1 aldehyde dehydrogenase (NAD+) [Prauserella marina]SDC26717.1 aldehyde dehydrogenase (NAD+) [Prauserella marina]
MSTATRITAEHHIDGDRVPPRERRTIPVEDPSTGETIARVARGDAADVDLAVRTARARADKTRQTAPVERGRLLRALARALDEASGEFALLETLDTGKPLSLARSEIAGCVGYLDYYAGAADKMHGETIPIGQASLAYTVSEPVGVTAHIVPWNAPLSMLCRSVAPALAAGNTAVVKPAEQTPLTALRFAELAAAAGCPPGTLNVVTGLGEEAGHALAAHPGIGSLTFTGSVATGRSVLRAAAEHITPVVTELGGKSPQIVFADADLDDVAAQVVTGFTANTGQYCDAGSRLLADRRIHDELVARIVERASALTLGPGERDPDLGPLISAEHHRRVSGYVEKGHDEGANLATAARELPGRGYFLAPTVFTGVTPGMRIAREEIFGPVLTVLAFDDEDHAAELADATDYGLGVGIHTRDIDRALRMANRVNAGYVMINDYFAGGVAVPFGGTKLSGTGRERGLIALDSYRTLKTVVARIGSR